MMDINKIRQNAGNPREIVEEKFQKLKESIQRDPKFMELRPIIIDQDGIIIAGNMRYRALLDLEYKAIPNNWIKKADKLTEEERRRFIVIDNLDYGIYDWDVLTSHYSEEELIDWGLDLPVDPFPEAEEDVPEQSHGFKIKCDNLNELIELRDMLNAKPESKSMSFGNFKLLFEHRK